MRERLIQLIEEVAIRNSKLILLVGKRERDRTLLLEQVAPLKGTQVVNVGVSFASRLAGLPSRQRALVSADTFRTLLDSGGKEQMAFLDRLEVLFDKTLRLDPLELLRRHAQARCVIASWPGELREGRLTYADLGHPEKQDYAVEGLVPFEI
jgi:hypothetical protein